MAKCVAVIQDRATSRFFALVGRHHPGQHEPLRLQPDVVVQPGCGGIAHEQVRADDENGGDDDGDDDAVSGPTMNITQKSP